MLYPHCGSLDTGSFILRWSISNFCSGVGGSKIACLQDKKRPRTLLTSLISICTKIKIQVPLFSLLTLLLFYPEHSESHLSMTLLLPGQLQPPLFLTLRFPFLSLCFSLIRLAWLKSSCSLTPLRLCHSPLIALSSQLSVLKARHLPGFISNFSFSYSTSLFFHLPITFPSLSWSPGWVSPLLKPSFRCQVNALESFKFPLAPHVYGAFPGYFSSKD